MKSLIIFLLLFSLTGCFFSTDVEKNTNKNTIFQLTIAQNEFNSQNNTTLSLINQTSVFPVIEEKIDNCIIKIYDNDIDPIEIPLNNYGDFTVKYGNNHYNFFSDNRYETLLLENITDNDTIEITKTITEEYIADYFLLNFPSKPLFKTTLPEIIEIDKTQGFSAELDKIYPKLELVITVSYDDIERGYDFTQEIICSYKNTRFVFATDSQLSKLPNEIKMGYISVNSYENYENETYNGLFKYLFKNIVTKNIQLK